MLKKLLRIIVLPCSTATYLMEKKIDATLTYTENIRLNLHIAICKWCKVYNTKIKIIHAAISKAQKDAIEKSPDLQQNDLESIKSRIKKKLGK